MRCCLVDRLWSVVRRCPVEVGLVCRLVVLTCLGCQDYLLKQSVSRDSTFAELYSRHIPMHDYDRQLTYQSSLHDAIVSPLVSLLS